MNRYIRLFNTVKFLKSTQIYYRLFYIIRGRFRNILNIKPSFVKKSTSKSLKLNQSIHIDDCYLGNNNFRFLNLSKEFESNIDWNYSQFGKLWTYNLAYFDFLSQGYSDKHLVIIEDFINNIDKIGDGMEPFPISLRGINWIKFLSYNSIENKKIDDSLYAQYYILLDNLEYHLLGNHLLENAFSLLFGAYYFRDELLYKEAKKILVEQLNEQILEDGGHFELSPMYHQIMLFRTLDCVNLLQNNSWRDSKLLDFFTIKAELMLGWLKNMSYSNGDIPLFNDSTNGIAPTTKQLLEYANSLELNIQNLKLSQSGYRKVSNTNYESIVDVGHIGAEYIAGHVHSDTFNFELSVKGKPFIVDTGLSTYEICERRTVERATKSHNSVEVNNKNQSEVWSGFRVANRANIVNLEEDENSIEATHDGYRKDKIYHTRKWVFEENSIVIKDRLSKNTSAIARLHFHPDISKDYILEHLKIDSDNWKFSKYSYSPKFNTQVNSQLIEIKFEKTLEVTLLF